MSSDYQVYVDASADGTDAGRSALATRIAQRYGMPVDAIAQRLAAGRFRVKGGVDLATAQTFASDLRSLGAICSVLDGTGAPVQAAAGPATAATLAVPATPAPAVAAPAVAAPAVAAPAVAAPAAPRPSQSALAGAQPSARPAQNSSGGALAGFTKQPVADRPAEKFGLKVADEWDEDSQDLGAIGAGEFALSTLDGADNAEAVEVASSFDPAGGDAFAPPDSETEDLELALDVEPPQRRSAADLAADEPLTLQPQSSGGYARPQSSPSIIRPSASHGASAAASQSQQSLSSASTYMTPAATLAAELAQASSGAAAAAPSESVATKLARRPRTRLAAGVLLAMLLGFVPAHFVAASRQDASYGEVDKAVRARYAEVTTISEWDALDEFRASQLTLKAKKQQNIAITSFVIWAALAGLVAFGWFRKIDWNRWA